MLTEHHINIWRPWLSSFAFCVFDLGKCISELSLIYSPSSPFISGIGFAVQCPDFFTLLPDALHPHSPFTGKGCKAQRQPWCQGSQLLEDHPHKGRNGPGDSEWSVSELHLVIHRPALTSLFFLPEIRGICSLIWNISWIRKFVYLVVTQSLKHHKLFIYYHLIEGQNVYFIFPRAESSFSKAAFLTSLVVVWKSFWEPPCTLFYVKSMMVDSPKSEMSEKEMLF